MGEVAKFTGGGLPANPEDLETGLKNVQQSIQASTGGVPFLRLSRAGFFIYGAENTEVEEGSEWAINPYSIMHGFACWAPGELLDERMVPFTEPPPNKAELPDLGQSWDQQIAMVMQCMNGEDEGTLVLYKGTSTGLRNASKELIGALIAQLQKDKQNIVPVVELEADSYKHKEYGQIFYPILTIKSWMNMEGVAEASPAPDDDGDDGDEDAAPETTEAAAPEPEQPTRRRRRKAPAKEETADAPPATNRRRRRRK